MSEVVCDRTCDDCYFKEKEAKTCKASCKCNEEEHYNECSMNETFGSKDKPCTCNEEDIVKENDWEEEFDDKYGGLYKYVGETGKGTWFLESYNLKLPVKIIVPANEIGNAHGERWSCPKCEKEPKKIITD
jgi:hypothetical protein